MTCDGFVFETKSWAGQTLNSIMKSEIGGNFELSFRILAGTANGVVHSLFCWYINPIPVREDRLGSTHRLFSTTLDSGINLGVHLLIFEKKWPQCLDWFKNELRF